MKDAATCNSMIRLGLLSYRKKEERHMKANGQDPATAVQQYATGHQ